MRYVLMRFSKYYDSFRTNKPFFMAPFKQKIKIIANILKFFQSDYYKPLVIKNKPVTAQIEPTSECNLRCEMCIRDKIGVPIGTMNFEDFKTILLKLNCLFKIHLSGQGEPFLNKNFFKMVEYANSRGILVNTNTNGVLLNSMTIDRICRADIGEIGVSIDSTKKARYEEIRRGAKFEIVIRNIKNLTGELKKRKKNTIVVLAVTLMKDNLNEVLDFVKLARLLGIKKVVFQTMQIKEDYVRRYTRKNKEQILPNFNSLLKKEMDRAIKLGKKYGINIIFDEGKSFGCIWPWRGIYITWNGYVTCCCKILDYKNPLMGNILEEDFWKIWNGKRYQMFRKFLRERKGFGPCLGCTSV